MSKTEFQYFYKRNLPHYQPPAATFFITFRLYGSLPAFVIKQLEEYRNFKKETNSSEKFEIENIIQGRAFTMLERYLDHPENGPQWLKDHQIAQFVSDAIHYRDGKVYTLDAFCIMPNHVHLVITPLMFDGRYYALAEIMKLIKGSTSRSANQILGRSGAFWQHESYDHAVRSEQELMKIVQYVLNNPITAGLIERWVYSRW
jgi:REP element-mobilizing transposase RayT